MGVGTSNRSCRPQLAERCSGQTTGWALHSRASFGVPHIPESPWEGCRDTGQPNTVLDQLWPSLLPTLVTSWPLVTGAHEDMRPSGEEAPQEVVLGGRPILHRGEGRDVVHRKAPAGKLSPSHTHNPCVARGGQGPVSSTELLVQPMLSFWFQCCFRFLGKKLKVMDRTPLSCWCPLLEVFHIYVW